MRHRKVRTVKEAMDAYERNLDLGYKPLTGKLKDRHAALVAYLIRNAGRAPMSIVRAEARRIGVEVTT